MGVWRAGGSTRLQNLAVRSMIVFNSASSGGKLVGLHNRMGMELASKFNGTLVAKSQLFKLVEGMLSIPSPTKGLQGVGLQPENLADRLLVEHSYPASKIETSSDKYFENLCES
eukprot:760706-Pelagomonas_calceolata.AAC.1